MPDPITDPAGDPPTNPPAGDPPAPKKLTQEELEAQLAETQKALKAANRESADRRKKLDEFEKAEEERKKAAMSETDKIKAENEKLKADKEAAEARANERLIRSEIVAVAAKLNFADPSDAVALLDKSKLEVKDDGAVDGIEDALKELLKAKPHLAKRAGNNLRPTNPGSNGSDNLNWNGETKEQALKRLGLR